jgi:hypothetical protein
VLVAGRAVQKGTFGETGSVGVVVVSAAEVAVAVVVAAEVVLVLGLVLEALGPAVAVAVGMMHAYTCQPNVEGSTRQHIAFPEYFHVLPAVRKRAQSPARLRKIT